MTSPRLSFHHYLFDVIPLLDECLKTLQMTIDRDLGSQHYALYDMKEVLCCAERLLRTYLEKKIHVHDHQCDIHQLTETYRLVLIEKQRQNEMNHRKIQFLNPQDPPPLPEVKSPCDLYLSRSATDSLLFRLIVALQLCLVRIDDAHLVITGRRIRNTEMDKRRHDEQQMVLAMGMTACCVLGAGVAALSWTNRLAIDRTRWKEILPRSPQGMIKGATSGMILLMAIRMANTQWKKLWMTDTIYKSTCEIDDWTRQWQAIQSSTSSSSSPQCNREQLEQETCGGELLEDKSRRLIAYAMKNSPKSYFWQSQGEIRFLMLKRFMDVYYASVGTAIDSSGNDPESKWMVPLVAGAAASFYSITGTGASIKASHVVNERSRDLIQHAWYGTWTNFQLLLVVRRSFVG